MGRQEARGVRLRISGQMSVSMQRETSNKLVTRIVQAPRVQQLFNDCMHMSELGFAFLLHSRL